MSNWFVANIPFFILLVFVAVKIVFAVKKGAVKELCSFISIIIASILVLLIGFGVRKFFNQERILFVVTIVLLLILLVIYKVLDLFFTTLKIISKLPVISLINKFLGAVIVFAETVIVVWAVYCLIMIFDTGAFEGWIMDCVRNNKVMRYLYENNLMYSIVAKFSDKLANFDILGKLGM